MGTRRQKFSEICVIYESAEDTCWVAHGVRTDQIGTGDCIVNALVDYMRAIVQVLEAAARAKDITIYRRAPPEIRAMAKKAPALPKEIYEIAHRKVFGTWPDDIAVKVDPQPKRPFKARVNNIVAKAGPSPKRPRKVRANNIAAKAGPSPKRPRKVRAKELVPA